MWLLVSLAIDLLHLSETVFILSKPNLMTTWPIIVAVSSCIWQELKIVRIKYRVIRRSLLVDTSDDYELEQEAFRKEFDSHRDSSGKFSLKIVNSTTSYNNNNECFDGDQNFHEHGNSKCALNVKTEDQNLVRISPPASALSHYVATNVVHFIKLLRNLYNLLTWHFTGYLFGGDYQHLISMFKLELMTTETYK